MSGSQLTSGAKVFVGGQVIGSDKDARLIVIRPQNASNGSSPHGSSASNSSSSNSASGYLLGLGHLSAAVPQTGGAGVSHPPGARRRSRHARE